MLMPNELSYADCRSLLCGGQLGRVAVSTPAGPHIIPLDYTVVENSIVFRTTPYSLLASYARNTTLAFEVDDVDATTHAGWSVVAVGRARIVEDPDELLMLRRSWSSRPWLGGTRSMYLRLPWRELTGHRLTGQRDSATMT